jgi:hypothetical protein
MAPAVRVRADPGAGRAVPLDGGPGAGSIVGGVCDAPRRADRREGWRTGHLAAHVVLRERDLLTSAGIALRPLTARTDRVTLAAGDLAQLLELFVHAFGRTSVAHVELEGTPDAVGTMESMERRARPARPDLLRPDPMLDLSAPRRRLRAARP